MWRQPQGTCWDTVATVKSWGSAEKWPPWDDVPAMEPFAVEGFAVGFMGFLWDVYGFFYGIFMDYSYFIELDDGTIYRKTLYLMVKTMVSD